MKTRSQKFDTKAEQETDKYGIVWTEKYNVHSDNVKGITHLSVSWNDGSYQIRVGDLTLTHRTKSAAEGKELAVRFLKQRLSSLYQENQDVS